jgi:hypothetical protein
MTTVGKVFAILNMLLGLLLSFLIIAFYAKSTPFARKYDEARGQLDNAYKSAATSYDQSQKADAKVKTAQDELNVAIKKKDDELQALRDQLATVQKQWTAEKNVNATLTTQVNGLQTESAKRQIDTEQLRVALEKEQKANLELIKQNDLYRQEKVLAEIQRDGFKDKNNQLMGQVELLAKDNARLSLSRGATTTTVSKKDERNPPAERVEGLVRGIDKEGLIKLTIGSDSGLVRGHTLEAYRINSTTQKYLGTVRIIEVTHNEAVAQPIGKLSSPIQMGDRVASRILGS